MSELRDRTPMNRTFKILLLYPTIREAKEAGHKLYFTGNPCSRGHVAERSVGSRACRECMHERYLSNRCAVISRSAEWRVENRERKNELSRLSRRRDIKAARAKEAEQRARYKEHKRVQVAAWKAKNLDRHRENQRRWAANNKDKMASYSQARRARIAGRENTLTAEDIAEVTRIQGGRCANCNAKPERLTVDHIQPISKGGENVRSNIQMLCKSCNCRKSFLDPIEFARRQGKLL